MQNKTIKQYTIISAVYNVERYLDTFFKSILKQTLNFDTFIDLIMVDDGSTDNSKNIIEKWQKTHSNIQYVYQDNSGQASARNKGLEFVVTPWVTFVDPDDFVSKNYFETIDTFLFENNKKNIIMISCKLIYYFEKWHAYIDSHPLRYNFKNRQDIVKINNLGNKIQLSASSAVFKTKLIKDIRLQFDKNIKPNFEDAHFIGQYVLEYGDNYVAFLREPKYFYRKRKDATSTVDTSWTKSTKYYDVLKFGYLNLFKQYRNRFNSVPTYIQRMVLYDLVWHYKRHIASPETISFLSLRQKEHYKALLYELFEYIDMKTIIDFELAGCEFFYKVALLNSYKNYSMPYQIIYIDKCSENNTKIHCHCFSTSKISCVIIVDGVHQTPKIIKNEEIKFMDQKFIIKYSIAFRIKKRSKNIQIIIDDQRTYINKYEKDRGILYEVNDMKIDKMKRVQYVLKNIARKVLLNG